MHDWIFLLMLDKFEHVSFPLSISFKYPNFSKHLQCKMFERYKLWILVHYDWSLENVVLKVSNKPTKTAWHIIKKSQHWSQKDGLGELQTVVVALASVNCPWAALPWQMRPQLAAEEADRREPSVHPSSSGLLPKGQGYWCSNKNTDRLHPTSLEPSNTRWPQFPCNSYRWLWTRKVIFFKRKLSKSYLCCETPSKTSI